MRIPSPFYLSRVQKSVSEAVEACLNLDSVTKGRDSWNQSALSAGEPAALHTRTKSTMSLEREYMHATTWLEYG